jgi:hypothetical protein
MWERLTDLSRLGNWSPECEHAAWLDDVAPGARTGARFEGRNRFGNGNVGNVVCVVTEADRPRIFAWVVLDDHEDPGRPGSIWRYELLTAGSTDRTLVRHSFTHGPGNSGLRALAEADPGQAAGVVERRLAQLHRHMIRTIAAMAAPV